MNGDHLAGIQSVIANGGLAYRLGNRLNLGEQRLDYSVCHSVFEGALDSHISPARNKNPAAAQFCHGSPPQIGSLKKGLDDSESLLSDETIQGQRGTGGIPAVSPCHWKDLHGTRKLT